MKREHSPPRALKTVVLALAFAFTQVGLVAETGDNQDPVIGGMPIKGEQHWYLSCWFGEYCKADDSWILHEDFGYIYCLPGSTTASMYFYDIRMESWWWTSKEAYPYIYVFDPNEDDNGTDIESAWLLCLPGRYRGCFFRVMTSEYAGEELYFAP